MDTPRKQLFPVSPVKESKREYEDQTPPVSPINDYGSPEETLPLASPRSVKRCPPPTPRFNRATPLEKQKQKRRMSEITKSTVLFCSDEDEEDIWKSGEGAGGCHHTHQKMHNMVASNSVPDLRITPAEDGSELGFMMKSPRIREPEIVLRSPRSKKSETPIGTPLRVVTYKTNVNPFSPSRGHPPALKEIQIPTEKEAVPRYVSDFEQHEEIGKGSFGSVHLCLNRTDGWTYAVKKLVYQTEKMRDKFLKEAYALAAIGHHPNIIRYYGSWEDKMNTTVYIQTEWCKGGSLTKHNISSQMEFCKVIQQIASALSYMHNKGFAHGDVKPENILVDTHHIDDNTSYKLCDLGQMDESGDGKYLAPEILQYDDIQQHIEPEIMAKADIFSLGMTIFEMAYERSTKSTLPIKQRSQISPEDILLPSHLFSKSFVILLRGMMHRDPSTRFSGEEVLRQPPLFSSSSSSSPSPSSFFSTSSSSPLSSSSCSPFSNDPTCVALLEIEQRKVIFLQKRIEELEQQLLKHNNINHSFPTTPSSKNNSKVFMNKTNDNVLHHGGSVSLIEKHLMPVLVSKSSHKTKKHHRKSAENAHRPRETVVQVGVNT